MDYDPLDDLEANDVEAARLRKELEDSLNKSTEDYPPRRFLAVSPEAYEQITRLRLLWCALNITDLEQYAKAAAAGLKINDPTQEQVEKQVGELLILELWARTNYGIDVGTFLLNDEV